MKKKWWIVILCIVLLLIAIVSVVTYQYPSSQKMDDIQEMGPGDFPEKDPNIAYV